MDDPTDSVVDELGRGESLVTALVTEIKDQLVFILLQHVYLLQFLIVEKAHPMIQRPVPKKPAQTVYMPYKKIRALW